MSTASLHHEARCGMTRVVGHSLESLWSVSTPYMYSCYGDQGGAGVLLVPLTYFGEKDTACATCPRHHGMVVESSTTFASCAQAAHIGFGCYESSYTTQSDYDQTTCWICSCSLQTMPNTKSCFQDRFMQICKLDVIGSWPAGGLHDSHVSTQNPDHSIIDVHGWLISAALQWYIFAYQGNHSINPKTVITHACYWALPTLIL